MVNQLRENVESVYPSEVIMELNWSNHWKMQTYFYLLITCPFAIVPILIMFIADILPFMMKKHHASASRSDAMSIFMFFLPHRKGMWRRNFKIRSLQPLARS